MEKKTRMRMGRKWVQLTMILFIGVGLILTGACSKKKIRTEYPSVDGAESQTTTGADAGSQGMQPVGIGQESLDSDVSSKSLGEGSGGVMGAAETSEMRAARERFESDDIYFEYDSTALLPEAQSLLMEKSEWLRNNSQMSIVIEGHTDERGTVEYNLALGDRRAESVRAFLMELGVDTSRIRTVSYGEENPKNPGHDEVAWAKNRRAHFYIEQ